MGKLGDCYVAAGRYMLDHGSRRPIVLVHGDVIGQGRLEGVKYGHAWIVDGDMVIDKSNGRDLKIDKDLYYMIGQITNTHKYTYKQTLEKTTKTGHWGPWE
jgi:hypothetical protein